MKDDEDVSLFVGCLPGHEERQIVLFPDGQVIGDLRGQEIGEDRIGEVVVDHGWLAAGALIETLTNGNGWYIDEVTPDGNGWWLKPGQKTTDGVLITGLVVGPTSDRTG